MAGGKLQQIIVTVPRRLEPAFTAHLRALAGQWPTSWTPAEGDRAAISLFLPARRGTARLLRSVRAMAAIVHRLQPGAGPVRARRRIIRTRDWARAWRNSFEPVRVSPSLVVKPTWARWPAQNGEVVIEIDPTLAFGTGHHPTTAFCLRMIERLARRKTSASCRRPLSLLDCGCGSGILIIAAARLGCAPAIGFDYDRQAMRVARANAKLNGVAGRTTILRGNVEKFVAPAGRRRFEVVTANLAADLLTGNARRLVRWVAPGGTLVLAGVLDRDARCVGAVFRALGWRRTAGESAGGWTSWAMRSVA
ncbi:MAG: 50S ribosomal protein L11 methyltransferase [Verrucomicrobia bacterium]|nr:50S ribosomal protein L11 methyltransferase [Verrucomicrobiota bacterium]